jgi:RHS repeat-associated protein
VVLDGTHAVDAQHDALGREVARLLPGGGRIDVVYDAMSRMIERQVSTTAARPVLVGPGEPDWVGPTGLPGTVQQTFHYAPTSEPIEVTDLTQGPTRFSYDANGRLAEVARDTRTERFAYDANGNVYERDGSSAGRQYGAGDRIEQKGATTYLWDDDGRLVETRARTDAGEEQRTQLTWDARGLLAEVRRPDGKQIRFAYDPFERRVRKQVWQKTPDGALYLEATTRFVWSNDQIIQEITQRAASSGDPIVEERSYCVDDRGFPWAHRDTRTAAGEKTASDWYHYLNDDIGTPQKLVSAAGAVACEIRRTAWGKAEIGPGAATSTSLGFLGQYHDEETGLCYNRHRYYDPESGRYISADPIGLLGGLNPFRYAENQPTRMVDPSGLMADATVSNRPGGAPNTKGSSGGDKPVDPAIQDAIDNAMTKVPNPGSTSGRCAEMQALSDQARDIRGKLTKDLGRDATNAEVREALRDEYRKGAKISTKDGKTPMNPCKFCAQVMRELGIHPDNIDKNPLGTEDLPKAKGGVMVGSKPWKGDEVHNRGDSPKTQDSTTPGATYNAPEAGAGGPAAPPPRPPGVGKDGTVYRDAEGNYIGPTGKNNKNR